ncbi:hypothetical protein C8Q75DRAFT_810256 [Abortiporus biennis]|nr:hypothetical protein C8Q75DRAFT_810256 [Abortiporus biennis]
MSRSTISQSVPTSSTRWNDSPIPKPGIKHMHKDLWFEDGSIVLQAENVIYRVYRGHLIRHSVVFRDMLAALQTPRAQTSQSAKDSPSEHDHKESISATDDRETSSTLAEAGVDDHDVPADVVVDLILSDTAFDTTNFLKALFDPCYFAELKSRGLNEIASILRLSTKYQVGATRSRVISILNKTFPTTLVNQRITEKSKSQPTL